MRVCYRYRHSTKIMRNCEWSVTFSSAEVAIYTMKVLEYLDILRNVTIILKMKNRRKANNTMKKTERM